MKSVSFSDLRNSSTMLNRSEQVSNQGDSIMKRSSSYKNLTYYSSSEDILRRFSSKTAEFKSVKDGYKSDDTNNEHVANPHENLSKTKFEETGTDIKAKDTDTIIKDLKSVISDQEKTMSMLQEENLLLKNESTKNKEEIKFQENRIKYLEHMLAAFNTNPKENKNNSQQSNERNIFYENSENKNTQQYCPYDKVDVSVDQRSDSRTASKFLYQKSNEIFTDLNKRPNSADSTLQNEYKYNGENVNKTKRNESCYKSNMSDSEERLMNSSMTDIGKRHKVNENVPKQRSQVERERSSNISDIKNRIDELSKYAKRSTEQNSLNQLSSTLPMNFESNRYGKYNCVSDNNMDPQYKVRLKGSSQGNDSRPPIDPYYKQRREMKVNQERQPYAQVQDYTAEEDENLKERVQKILDRHKYSAQPYRSDDYKKVPDSIYRGSSDGSNNSGINRSGLVAMDQRYNYQQMDIQDNYDISTMPRLDLTLNSSTADNLIAKYLNHQGFADVS